MAPKKKPAAAASAPMEPGGESESWAQAQANQMRIADLCLEDLSDAELKARTGSVWNNTPEDVVCTELMFGYLATFVSSKYTIEANRRNAGKMLGIKTALGIFSGVLNQTQRRFSASSVGETQVRYALCTLRAGGDLRAPAVPAHAPSARARKQHVPPPPLHSYLTSFLRRRRHSSNAWLVTTLPKQFGFAK